MSKLFVVGILLIDSPIHIPLCKLPACGPDPDFSDLPEMVRKSFDKFDAMLYMCELPTWDSPACQGKTVRVSAGKETFEVDAGSMLHRSKDGDWRPVALGNSQDGHVATEKFTGPPPAALVRCLRRTPTGKPSQGPSHVDRYRDDLLLGWEGRHQSFIKAVVDVDSHHFNVLDVSHVSRISRTQATLAHSHRRGSSPA